MAARTRTKLHDDEVRRRIQTSQLINRLNDNAMGKIELSQGQIKSIEILLKKSIPDLANIQLSGDEENPVKVEFGWAS